MSIEKISLNCPHCWEKLEIRVDAREAHFVFVEDCEVCCNPIRIEVWPDPGNEPEIRVSSAND